MKCYSEQIADLALGNSGLGSGLNRRKCRRWKNEYI